MFFLSSKELSQKWGISQRRIILLAREGRIPGAQQHGKAWLFPENVTKPEDGRTKEAKANPPTESSSFRYPIFEHRRITSFSPPLDAEELCIKAVTEAIHACRFQDADLLLGDRPETAENRYHRISFLYVGCMIDLCLCNAKRFLKRYNLLVMEFLDDFPYRTEMKEYLYLLDATLGYKESHQYQFRFDLTYPYHESFLPRLVSLCSVHIPYDVNNIQPDNLQSCEASCLLLEKMGYYSDSQSVHLSLGIVYSLLGRMDEKNLHLKKALILAQKYDLYYQIADSLYYMKKIYQNVLPDFPEDFVVMLQTLCEKIHNAYICLLEKISVTTLYKLLDADDFSLVLYAVRGLTNKKIAEKLKISAINVAKRYSRLYAALNVKNKVELVKTYKAFIAEYFQ